MVHQPLTGAGLGAGLAAVAALGIGLLAPFEMVSEPEQRALGITLFALILWTAQTVPIELSSLAVLLLLPATGLLDFAGTFAPFAGPTVWLVFSGMVLSLLLSATGLGRHLADASLPLLAGGGRVRLLLVLHVVGVASAFLVPSGVVRVLLLMPLGLALVRTLDPEALDPALPPAVTLSIVCSTYYGGCGVLTGAVPNLVVAGQLEAASGRIVYWGEWLRWMFPVLGALRTGLCFGVIWLLWGRRLRPLRRLHAGEAPAPLNGPQRRTLVVLLAGGLLWSTDIVHGLAPVYVGLLLVLAAVVPRIGPLAAARLREVDYPFFFYIAALFGIGAILDDTGFNQRMVRTVLAVLPDAGGHWLGEHLTLTAAALPLDFLMDIAAVGAVVTPSLLDVGAGAGLTPLASAMSVAMATTVAFLPYQAAPFMVVLGFGSIRPAQLAVAMLLISTLSLLSLAPLNVIYWRWTGLI